MRKRKNAFAPWKRRLQPWPRSTRPRQRRFNPASNSCKPKLTLWNEPLASFHDLSLSAREAKVYVDREDASGPLQKQSTDHAATFGGAITLGNGGNNVELTTSESYRGHGASAYIREWALYVSTGPGAEQLVTPLQGNSGHPDIGAQAHGEMHVVIEDGPPSTPYNIYYCRYLAPPAPDAPAPCGAGV